MDIVLLILALTALIVGLIGSVLPALPGVPVSWVGLLLFYCVKNVAWDWWMLGITLAVVVAIQILDYVIPSVATKKFGGSKYGIWGTNIGLVVGLLAPIPFGVIIGPAVGAFLGELLFNRSDAVVSLKAATGSMLGFLASSFMQFVIASTLLGIFIYKLIENWSVIF